jgi:sugar phosphate isomerase/epimerase
MAEVLGAQAFLPAHFGQCPAGRAEEIRGKRMQFCYFTKHWPEMSVENLCRMAHDIGADGLDLCVRGGNVVNPDNVTTALPEAVRVCRNNGISIGMITMEWMPTDPRDPKTQALFATCGDVGVKLVKIGYWRHKTGDDYWAAVDRYRGDLDEIGKLAKKCGIVACYHTHSGGYYGSNAAGLMHLLRGQDPESIGAYLDTCHLAANGERLPFAIDMVKGYLRLFGVKSFVWERKEKDGRQVWNMNFVRMRDGLADTRLFFQELKRVGFNGVLSIFGEHSLPIAEVPSANRDDIIYCKEMMREVGL